MPSHSSLLVLNDDILHLLCLEIDKVVPLSSTCRRLRTAAAPLLWRRMTVSDKGKRPSDRPGLEGFLDVVVLSQPCARFTQQLLIENHMLDDASAGEARKLAGALVRLERLRRLRLAINKGKGHICNAFHGRRFPAIETLAISVELHDELPSFPNIRHLQLDVAGLEKVSSEDLLVWTGKGHFQHLQHLETGPGVLDWDPALLEQINKSLPRLRYLGTIRSGSSLSDPLTFQRTITSLAPFKHLRALRIALQEHINAIVNNIMSMPFPNASLHGQVRLMEEQKEAYVQNVGPVAFGRCPTLEDIWVEGGERTDSLFWCKPNGDVQLQRHDMVWTPSAGRESAFAW